MMQKKEIKMFRTYGTPDHVSIGCSINILCRWHYSSIISRNACLELAPEEQHIYRKKK
jgi:hypothetical protein